MSPSLIHDACADEVDVILARLVEADDPEAWSELMTHVMQQVRHVAWRLLGNAADIDDITQETALRVQASLPRFAHLGEGCGRAWLRHIAWRTTLTHIGAEHSRRRRERVFGSRQVCEERDPSDGHAIADEFACLRRCIADLPGHHRQVIELRFFKELPYQAIADELGLGEDAARKRVQRAVHCLRRRLRRAGLAISSTALLLLLGQSRACAGVLSIGGTSLGFYLTWSLAAVLSVVMTLAAVLPDEHDHVQAAALAFNQLDQLDQQAALFARQPAAKHRASPQAGQASSRRLLPPVQIKADQPHRPELPELEDRQGEAVQAVPEQAAGIPAGPDSGPAVRRVPQAPRLPATPLTPLTPSAPSPPSPPSPPMLSPPMPAPQSPEEPSPASSGIPVPGPRVMPEPRPAEPSNEAIPDLPAAADEGSPPPIVPVDLGLRLSSLAGPAPLDLVADAELSGVTGTGWQFRWTSQRGHQGNGRQWRLRLETVGLVVIRLQAIGPDGLRLERQATVRVEPPPMPVTDPGPGQVDPVMASLDSGLVAHWQMDKASDGRLRDRIAGRDGAIDGAASAPGFAGAGLAFDGVDDRVAVPPFDVTGQAMSIAAWIHPQLSVIPEDFSRIISKGRGIRVEEHFWMLGLRWWPQQDGKQAVRLIYRLRTAGRTEQLLIDLPDLPMRWLAVAAVYDGSTMRVFLDGSEVGRMRKTGRIDADGQLGVSIGNQLPGRGVRPFAGRIDDLRVYERALLPDEIDQLAAPAPADG